ncbi:hypothetical protein KR074_004982 [Drosophila pseudoananassae]|nr:hypothetical protein KR074_004982 [Drosophila pseudoananassae]
MQRILTICALVACGLVSAMAQNCQVCQDSNDVYCLNQTSYQFCMSGSVIGEVQSCAEGSVCSNANDACVATSEISATILDVCADSSCGVCNINTAKYTCVSSTQYARCTSQNEFLTILSCPEDKICISDALATYGSICVPACAAEFLDLKATCSNAEFATTTTTAAPTTTPDPANLQGACTTGDTTSKPPYFYTKYSQDTTCKSYVYCQRNDSEATNKWTAVFLTCTSTKPYFDSETKKCVETKPTGC